MDTVADAENTGLQDIAIIGMSCRFPQTAEDVENFWAALIAGRSSSTDFPADKMNIDAHYHPDANHGGTMACRGGHFLSENARYFDAPFFSITQNEAMAMDPQGRILMENVYHALENAGLTIDKVASGQVSVFVGASNSDFKQIMGADEHSLLKYLPVGTAPSILSNRISWFFDFRGASMTVDTACSSSLVAFHLGCQDIRSGNSKMAIVSGVNLLDDPDMMFRMSHVGFLSPDSICHSFDHRANGYARGEGVGTLILKPVADAIRDGDTIRAVVRGTGSNQDGHTPGMSMPSYQSQENLIRTVYAQSRLKLEDTGYVEAHGTGTPVGDPIEARAIGNVWKIRRDSHLPPLIVGAVKSAIGHLEGASGVAGLIKTVLVLENGIIPPNLNFEKVNPKIPADDWHLQFPTAPMQWPSRGLRRASVSSFGVGGTNAHAILDDAYHYLQARDLDGAHFTVDTPEPVENGTCETPNCADAERNEAPAHIHVNGQETGGSIDTTQEQESAQSDIENSHPLMRTFVWSTSDEDGLKRTFNTFESWLQRRRRPESEDTFLANLAYTLAEKRTQLSWRTFTNASSITELLENLANGPQILRHVRPNKRNTLGFVFTGQGAQWAGMGRELLMFPVFRESVQDANHYLRHIGNKYDIKEELEREADQSRVNEPDLSQVLTTVIQIALVDLLRQWNIRPKRIVGHSSGEIAAAYCLGGLCRESAWKVAYFRGLVASSLIHRQGRMLAVGMSEESLLPHLGAIHEEANGDLSIACFNSPANLTVAGDGHMVDLLRQRLEKHGAFVRQLKVKVAYHSAHMSLVAEEYGRLMGRLSVSDETWADGEAVMVSSVTGKPVVNASSLADPEYWVRNMTSPVRFVAAMEELIKGVVSPRKRITTVAGNDRPPLIHMVEVGPHPAMQSAVQEIVEANPASAGRVPYYWAIRRKASAVTQALDLVGKLYCEGHPVCLSAVNQLAKNARMLVDIPPYSFNHTRDYMAFGRLSKNFLWRRMARHDLLGAPVRDWDADEPRWRNFLRVHEMPWLKDHVISGQVIYPAAGYMVMAIEAMKAIADSSATINNFRLRHVVFKAVLRIPDTVEGIETMFTLRRQPESSYGASSSWYEFKVCSYQVKSESWTEHCTGLATIEYSSSSDPITAGSSQIAIRKEFEALRHRANRECTLPVDVEKVMADLNSLGMVFGPTMRGLSTASRGNGTGQALGTVVVPDVRASMPHQVMEPHIIHPVTMDACTQLLIVAIGDLANKGTFTEIMLPRSVKELSLSPTFINKPGAEINCHVASKRISHNSVHQDMTAWSANASMPEFTISQYRTVLLERPASNHQYQRPYTIEWKPDVDLMQPQEIVEYLRQKCENDGDFACNGSTQTLAEDLDSVVSIFIQRAWSVLYGISSSLPDHLQKYSMWLREAQSRLKLNFNTSRKQQDELIQRITATCVEGELVSRVFNHFQSIVTGETDLFELLMQEGLLERFYAENRSSRRIQELLRSYGSLYGHKTPDLRVLEVGAGDGASTKAFLPGLRTQNYTYTDISAAFFARAQKSLGSWADSIDFRKFDISEDPKDQGFEPDSFDLILAVDVIHGTSDVHHTLQNLRSLLKPSGKLFMVEICKPEILLYPFVFGLLPGWWNSKEAGRKDGPLQSSSWWNAALKSSGFSDAELTINDRTDKAISHRALMVAAPAATPDSIIEPSGSLPVPTLIIPPNLSANAGAIVEALADTMSSSGEKCPIVDILHVTQHEEQVRRVCVVLDLESQLLLHMSDDLIVSLRRLFDSCSGLLWVGEDDVSDPNSAIITGLLRTLRWELEFREQNLVTLGVGRGQNIRSAIDSIKKIYQFEFGPSSQTAIRQSRRNSEYRAPAMGPVHINRLVLQKSLDQFFANRFAVNVPEAIRIGSAPNRVLALTTDSPGLLDRLHFKDCDVHSTPLKDFEVEYRVLSTGLNFLDVMSAMGEVPTTMFGGEAAGIVTRIGPKVEGLAPGDRIAALSFYTGTFQTVARTIQDAAVAIPETMSFEHAAGFPIIYCTAFYCLVEIGRLKKGESILIHAAAGGVGQAALMLANHIGAKVFATVSSESKKKVVMAYGVPEERIFYSRSLTFAKMIRSQTNNRGVDVVLNSLAGEALRATFECMAPCGRFIEIGKRDFVTNGRLDMAPFLNSVTFAACDLNTVLRYDPPRAKRLLQQAMELWKRGVFCPTTPFTTYKYSQLEMAFRQLQSGKHIGKVVLTVNDDDVVQALPQLPPPCEFPHDATYVLSGGLGGLGRSAARWMASRGARHFLFLSRSGVSKPDGKALLKELGEAGCTCQVVSVDISNVAALREAIQSQEKTMPPVRGCIQGAMTLLDSTFETMTSTMFENSIKPKGRGSWNLHEVLPKDLDFFILLSSCGGIVGNRGQANYNAGNTMQDALAHYRQSQGLRATSLDLGHMLEVGVIAESTDNLFTQSLRAAFGTKAVPQDEFHTLLEYHCNPRNQDSCAQTVIGLSTRQHFVADKLPEPAFLSYPLFTHLSVVSGSVGAENNNADTTRITIRERINNAENAEKAVQVVIKGFIEKLSSLLSKSAAEIDSELAPSQYGVDSLVAIEIRNWLSKEVGADVAVLDIVGSQSIASLGDFVIRARKA